ncbi:hypothetical protein [uncultured Brevundimonas sp.]|uniref:hypothetical protein n=1 Tax=uncultured Brevundimonas sp. TaxID=213418 RepID=UPI002600E2A5|nr:hypothetical protein [uncultured Brevundimonas sp.]
MTRQKQGWMDRCIVLTPTASWGAWVDRLSAAAERHNFKLVVFHDDCQEESGPGDDRIFLTSNPKFIQPSPLAHVALIVVDAQTAAPQTSVMTGAQGRDAVVDASRLLVETLLTPASCVVTDGSLALKGRQVELFPGFSVEAPESATLEPQSDLDRASAAAFEVYRDGLPAAGATFDWSHDLFLYDPRRRDQRVEIQQLDMTGGPRSLVHGPDMILPPGVWEVTAQFSMDQAGSAHRLRIEWGVGDDFNSFDATPTREGVFKLTISHLFESVGPVELRIKLTEGCMGGYFEFHGATLKLLRAGSFARSLPSTGQDISQVMAVAAFPQ